MSVRLSDAGILSKRLYILNRFHNRVAPYSSLSTPKGMAIVLQGGMKKSWFSTNISLYLGNDARWSQSCHWRRI